MEQKVIVIYASTSGNTEAVVEAVCAVWEKLNIPTEMHRAEQVDATILEKSNYFLLATSTWEHGVINPFFMQFFKSLENASLQGKYASFIGTGDTRYEPVLFCGGMNMLRERWLEKGGQEIGTALKINGEPYQLLNTRVAEWATSLVPQIHEQMKAHPA
ncbi:MAG: flavodoxin family protein [Microgenomates group bacterium]